MRQSQKSNRSRGRGNRKSGGGGGNNINRVFDSAGPEGKVRGTPTQIIEKYLTLARDAQTSGDRVGSENFLQHAEHYQRILIAATSEQDRVRRESTAAATDDTSGEQPAVAAEAAETQPKANPQPRASEDNPAPTPQPAADIDGMAMIDASGQPDDLVVAPEEAVAEPARQNGSARRPRRRTPKPAQDAPEATATAEPSTPAEAAEG